MADSAIIGAQDNRTTTAEVSFVAAIASALGGPVRSVRVVEHATRLYSQIWLLDVNTGVDTKKVIAKSWTQDKTFQIQKAAVARARRCFKERDDVCIPYLGSCEAQRLLFMEYIEDQSLCDLLKLAPNIAQAFNLKLWLDRVTRAAFAAGQWLRDWHASGIAEERQDLLLGQYLDKREECLALIDHDLGERLKTLIASLDTEITAPVHGDFTPFNVLWSKDKLTVLDFGIAEWQSVSPWWDCISMEIGLLRELKFSARSPGKWVPALARSAISAFWRGYGPTEGSTRARHACAAVRHLVLYANDIGEGSKYKKRADWHHRNMLAAIQAAEPPC